MTNREKLKELFPYLNIVGTVFTDKRTEQVLAASVNFNWLDAEYKEPIIRDDALPPMPYAEPDNCGNYIAQNTMEQVTKDNFAVDCISRKAALSNEGLFEFRYYDDYLKMRKYLENLPSVRPQPRKGHWIKTGDYYTGAYGGREYVECSCCHEDSLEEGDFCPNCGADMRASEV